MRVYFDHNAGSPLRPAAREAMMCFITGGIEANPASVHHSGQRARKMLERARAEVASLIDAPPRSIVFTSGGTEANNLAICGAVRHTKRRRIVSSPIEHSSVRGPLAELKRQGFEVVELAVDYDGRIVADRDSIDSDTALVSIGLANSEVGTIQDLRAIAETARHVGALLHVDAAQAVGRIPIRIADIDCDLMTISAHKLGGPAGVGALYVRPGCRLEPQLRGGPQEGGLRAGTPNLCGVVGFGAAAREVRSCLAEERDRIASLTQVLFERLERSIEGLCLNGPREGRLVNTLNLTFPASFAETLLIALDLEGIEVSVGSACAAGSVEPSHVLLAMGRSVTAARSSIRLSLGWNTTPEEIEYAAEKIPAVWRRVSAFQAESLLSADTAG
jgi:cysteine desulfurase